MTLRARLLVALVSLFVLCLAAAANRRFRRQTVAAARQQLPHFVEDWPRIFHPTGTQKFGFPRSAVPELVEEPREGLAEWRAGWQLAPGN